MTKFFQKPVQWMIHWKWTTQWGVEKAMTPTPPAGSGWRLHSVVCPCQNLFVFYWRRRSKAGLPENEFPRL